MPAEADRSAREDSLRDAVLLEKIETIHRDSRGPPTERRECTPNPSA
jgi:hypothetical protein